MGSYDHEYTTGIIRYQKDDWSTKREASYKMQTNGIFLVLQMMWHSIKMALIVVSLHVCFKTFLLVNVPHLLAKMTLLIHNAENEWNFQYWMDRQLNELRTIHCFKWLDFIVLSVNNCNIKHSPHTNKQYWSHF